MNDAELDAVADMRDTLDACLDFFKENGRDIMAQMVEQTLETAKVFDLDDEE